MKSRIGKYLRPFFNSAMRTVPEESRALLRDEIQLLVLVRGSLTANQEIVFRGQYLGRAFGKDPVTVTRVEATRLEEMGHPISGLSIVLSDSLVTCPQEEVEAWILYGLACGLAAVETKDFHASLAPYRAHAAVTAACWALEAQREPGIVDFLLEKGARELAESSDEFRELRLRLQRIFGWNAA